MEISNKKIIRTEEIKNYSLNEWREVFNYLTEGKGISIEKYSDVLRKITRISDRY